jgi:hypothetical protein
MVRADEAEPNDLLPSCLPVALESWEWDWLVAAADEDAVDRLERAAGALLPFPVLILFLKRPKQPISREQ